jgi:hypothetical protein
VIALLSPDRFAETGLCVCRQEKNGRKTGCGFDQTLSPVRFGGKTYGIAAIFSDSCSNTARFLCNQDCVAERLRFEPSLPLCRAAKSPCIRNMQRILQHTRLIQRIASALESGENSPFSYSAEWRTPSDCQLKVISFAALSAAKFVRPRLRAYRAVQERKISPQDVLVKRRMAGDFRRFLPLSGK